MNLQGRACWRANTTMMTGRISNAFSLQKFMKRKDEYGQ